MTTPEWIAKHAESGDVNEAVNNAKGKVFELMKQFPEGVDPSVMFAGNQLALDYIALQLIAMVMEVTGEVRGWADSERQLQEQLAYKLCDILRQDALIAVLEIELTRREVFNEQIEGQERLLDDAALEGETEGTSEGDE